MDHEVYRNYLNALEIPTEQIADSFGFVQDFETWLAAGSWQTADFPLSPAQIERYSNHLVASGQNTWDRYLALIRYARCLKHHNAQRVFIELIDGSEVMENLYGKLEQELGQEVREQVFQGLELPPLGTPNRLKPTLTRTVIQRLEAISGEQTCCRLLEDCLRDLPEDVYLVARRKYQECGSLDAYQEQLGQEFIAELERLQAQGNLYFTQPVTDEMIAFVRANPEIGRGVRRGDNLYQTKIPYMTANYLAETDEQRKRYFYCHCPWVRASLLDEQVQVPPNFCNCSAGFMKKPWEVIFGQRLHAEMIESILQGDAQCRVAIRLPEEV